MSNEDNIQRKLNKWEKWDKSLISAGIAEAELDPLNSQYLNLSEKLEVQMWYNFPDSVTVWAFLIAATYSIYNPLSLKEMICIPLVTNVIVFLLNWFFYSKKFIQILSLTILHNWIQYLAGLGAVVFLFSHGAIILGIIALLSPFGVLIIVSPSTYFNHVLTKKYRMHPKFVFFKLKYGYEFPFEKDSD